MSAPEQDINLYQSEKHFGIVAKPPLRGTKLKYLSTLGNGITAKHITVINRNEQVFVFDRLAFGYSDTSSRRDTARALVFKRAVDSAVLNFGEEEVGMNPQLQDFTPYEQELRAEIREVEQQPIPTLKGMK